MENFPGFSNQGFPSGGIPGTFPALGNIGAPYMATLSLPGLTIGFPMWLFPTAVVPTIVPPSTSPPEQHHVGSKVDPSPSSPISTSSSSTSLGESIDSSNQVVKKKKKKTKKKKSDKREGNSVAITPQPMTSVGKPCNPPQKVKFPCMLCQGDHFLRECLGIPKVLETWSNDRLPLSSTSEN